METVRAAAPGGRRGGAGPHRRRRAPPRGRRRDRHRPRRRRGRGRSSDAPTASLRAGPAGRPSSSPDPARARRGPRRSTPPRAQASRRASGRRGAGGEPARRARRSPRSGRRRSFRRCAPTPPTSIEADAVELALRIAEQALGAAIAADPELVVDVVRGALRRLVERDRVLILVNPDDLELVRDHASRLVGELGGIEHCEVQAERRVRPRRRDRAHERGRGRRDARDQARPRPRGARARARQHWLSPTRRSACSAAVARADLHRRHGRVSDLIGLIVEATGLEAEVGEVCEIATGRGRAAGAGRGGRLPRRPHAAHAARRAARHRPGQRRHRHGRARPRPRRRRAARARARRPRPPARRARRCPTGACARPPAPRRTRSSARASASASALGVRALDALVPCGRGQRLGIFAGSGVGKSSLLGMIARSTTADINVICLVGERGREVREFIERDLGDAIGALGRDRGHLRPAGARAHQGGADRDHDRRALPRPGPRRPADDGLGHALRHGPARGRPGHRRAARHARLHALRLRPAAQAARALRHQRRAARSPASTPCSSTATT